MRGGVKAVSLRAGLLFWAVAMLLQSVSAAGAGSNLIERPEWESFFTDAGVAGTIVIADERSEPQMFAYDAERAAKRMSPASTFKIPHALFALDAGLVKDEFEVIPWDGKERAIAAWNRDQNLRSSMRESTVWVYEKFAERLGEARERDYLEKIAYGNADPSGDQPFWIEGNLEISALEQIALLKKLYRNELPFDVADQRLVKDIMIRAAGRDWILRGKTGWSGEVGWFIGWIEGAAESPNAGPVFFALNIDTPNRMEDLPKREDLVHRILSSIGANPSKATP